MALNGQFPSAMLAHLGWPEADHLQLVPGAAASLTRLAVKFEAAFGKPLYLSDAYRTLAAQKALKISKGKFAATPGTSNHGLGLAIDMASRINVDGSAEHLWMSVHGPEFGWINPYWAVDFNPANGQHEPWHWEFDYRLDRSTFAQAAPIAAHTPITEDPFMALTNDEQRDMLDNSNTGRARIEQVYNAAVTIMAAVERLPGIQSQVDLTRSAVGNATNGIVTLLGRAVPANAAPGDIALTDADLARIATAVADEQHRRSAA